MNVFSAVDAFDILELTEAINKLPFVSGDFARLYDAPTFLSQPFFAIELKEGHVSLVSDSLRDVAPNVINREDPRAVKTMRTCHLAQAVTVSPEDVAGVRAFGSISLDSPARRINEKQMGLKRNLELTLEFMRLGALKGQIFDPNTNELLYDMFDIFNKKQLTATFDFTATPKKNENPIYTSILNIQRQCDDAMQGNPYDHLECIVGSEFYDRITTHDLVRPFFEQWMAYHQTTFGNNDFRKGFPYGGMTFIECSKTVAGKIQVEPDEGYVYPVGQGIWRQYYAPADWRETVNTPGLQFYSRMDAIQYGRGWYIEAQTNPCFLCTYPEALCKISIQK